MLDFLLLVIPAILAALAVAVIFGTDMLAALVLRPAYAEIDDRSMVQVVGRTHRLGNRRLPVPGVIGVIATVLAALAAFVTGQAAAGISATVALVLLLVWLVLFNRISLPINRVFIAASESGEVPADARGLQDRWDSIIVLRATLQGVALLGLCLAIALATR